MTNTNPWIVLKFGGTSVSTAKNWATIAKVVKQKLENKARVCIVHSALSGVSNQLEEALNRSVSNEHIDVVNAIREQHVTLATELGLTAEPLLNAYFEILEHTLQGISLVGEYSPRTQAKVVSLGELMSTTLGAAYLQRELSVAAYWLDARHVLKAEGDVLLGDEKHYLNSTCDFQPEPELQRVFKENGPLVITQGFIASNIDGETVLLGRGGSDTSGAYFAAKLEAKSYEVWTDVPGMFTANPRAIPAARLIKHISYDEAQEIATTGAKILHPRCIHPVRERKIPTKICSTPQPELEGTLITDDVTGVAQVKAISARKNVILISMETVGMWHQVGFLADAFAYFKQFGLSVDLVSTSESSVTVSLDPSAGKIKRQTLEHLQRQLSTICRVSVLENCAAVSIVGHNIRTILHKLADAFEVFHEHKIHLLSQAANDLNLTIVVDELQADRLVQQLHEIFITQNADSSILGLAWEQIFAKVSEEKTAIAKAWWQRQAAELIALAKQHQHAYVYHLPSVQGAIDQLQSLSSIKRVFYAIKANAHPEILQRVYDANMGFECVSPEEIEHVLALFPSLDKQRILFTPNFAPREEYQYGIEKGVILTLDNLYPLQAWPEVFKGRDILIRIDPGKGQGHHEHVKTAGNQSKFGVPLFQMDELVTAVKQTDCRVIGLHSHSGSGILDHENWKNTALTLVKVAENFPDVKYLDLGGGLGVPEKNSDVALNFAALDGVLSEVKKAFPQYEYWLEPGRFLVAQSGVLLATVTQTKGKEGHKYVGISTGMNSLIRPALYGAHHEIANLTKLNQAACETVDIVGPICETGDKLGVDRHLPMTEEGDIIAIANTGAYGKVMGSMYNRRESAREFVLTE
ncbi:MAG: bifunctional aspartate kinase/diaminopimelate decarboxylase [Pseudomonadota bacterium]